MERWRKSVAAARSGESKYKLLVQAIVADIDDGTLEEGTRLPPQRDLAHSVGISVQTVANAYKELEQHGLIRCEVGRGSFVARRLSEKVSAYILDRPERSLIDFSTARIVHTAAHAQAWCRTCAALATESTQPWMHECRPIAGMEHHRAAGVEWLQSLGVPASADSLLITNGTSQAVFLALASLVNPGDVVLCEDVTDHGVIGLAQVLGFTLKGLDSDEHGIHPDHFEDMCANDQITALVCTPNLNNPTVSLMPESRRRAIARIAERYRVHVIEDDVFGPLLAQRLPPITSHLPELGFHCTSFTKSVLTGLRVGYLSLPKRHALRAESILRVSSWMTTPLLAEVATRWIADGTASRLLALQRERLALRQAMVQDLLGKHVLAQHPAALSAWVAVPPRWQVESLVQHLRLRHIAVTSPDPFVVPGCATPHAIRLCVGADVSDVRVNASLATIASVFDQYPAVHDFR